MAKNQEFTQTQREKAVSDYFNNNKTQKQIAKALNCAPITIAKWVAWAREGRSLASMTSTRGRKSTLAKKHQQWIEKKLDESPKLSMAQLTRELNKRFNTDYNSGIISRFSKSHTAQQPAKGKADGASVGRSMGVRLPYDTDLSDEQWNDIKGIFTNSARPKIRASKAKKYPVREIVNGIRYVAISGVPGKLTPHDLPDWQTLKVSYEFWLEFGIWQEVNFKLDELLEIAESKLA